MVPQPSSTSPSPDPRPLSGEIRFEEGDFHVLSEGLAADPQYNDRRLVARRKLLTLAKGLAAELAREDLALDCRTSLHHPHSWNGMRVRRLWAYLCRTKAEKRRLRGVLGAELGNDLDAAFRNAYLCLALEAEALEVSLRIHPEGWYDGQNLKHRIAREGPRPWLELLRALGPGWFLRMHDWKGEWRCADLAPEALEEFLGYWIPGEHRLAVERRWPAPPGAREALLQPDVPAALVGEARRLAPLYRYAAWSQASDFLFAR